MDRPIAARGFRSRETSWLPSVKSLHLPYDKRTVSWVLIVFALILALAGEYTLILRTTKAPADLARYQSPPATVTAPAATSPEITPVESRAVIPLIHPVFHAPLARAAAINVTRVAPIKQQPAKAPAKPPTPAAPAPPPSCNGTVASLTQPVANLLPGPLGGSSGVVQTVACVLP